VVIRQARNARAKKTSRTKSDRLAALNMRTLPVPDVAGSRRSGADALMELAALAAARPTSAPATVYEALPEGPPLPNVPPPPPWMPPYSPAPLPTRAKA